LLIEAIKGLLDGFRAAGIFPQICHPAQHGAYACYYSYLSVVSSKTQNNRRCSLNFNPPVMDDALKPVGENHNCIEPLKQKDIVPKDPASQLLGNAANRCGVRNLS
jgi:hypothetical protein